MITEENIKYANALHEFMFSEDPEFAMREVFKGRDDLVSPKLPFATIHYDADMEKFAVCQIEKLETAKGIKSCVMQRYADFESAFLYLEIMYMRSLALAFEEESGKRKDNNTLNLHMEQ